MKKTQFAYVAGGLALMALSSVAMASVIHTKHNFSVTNTGGAHGGGTPRSSNSTNDTTEICVFCHTPHGADQTAYAPLWNRAQTTVNPTTGFKRFSSLNRWSFTSAEAPIGAVSIACLSCHDGTQAVSSIINTSGSDTTGSYSMNQFSAMSELASPDGPMNQAGDGSRYGLAAPAPWGDMIYIGTDLSNDHPISMQYGGGGVTSLAPTGPTVDHDFANATSGDSDTAAGGMGLLAAGNPGIGNTDNGPVTGSATGVLNHDTVANGAFTNRWWIDTGGTGLQGTDLKLYTRNDVNGGSGLEQPTVECGTCHDPHSGNTVFLREPGNENSQVCLTCHAK